MLRYASFLALFAGMVIGVPISEPERHKVIIIGAGVSGFTAAATLLEHNVTDVLLLEASDRIGGRVQTVQFGGVTIDKGAEFVHGQKGNSVYELMKPFDFLTSYKDMMDQSLFHYTNTSGHKFNATFVNEVIDDAYFIFEEDDIKHFNGSLADYFFPRLETVLSARNVDPYLSEAVRHLVPLLILADAAGDDLAQHGAWGFTNIRHAEGDMSLKWKPGRGYQTIFDVLSKKIPNPSEELPVVNKTLLGKEVTRVEQKDGEVLLTCTDGSTYIADHVIVTLALGLMKKQAATMFHPALSAKKTTAIETLGFGCLAKVFLLFPTKWWPDETRQFIPLFSRKELADYVANSKYGYWSTNITGFEQVIYHERMLYVWFSGKTCRHLDTLTDEEITDGLMEMLEKTVGDQYDIPRPESIFRSAWGSYKYTLGSYSLRTVESDRLNVTNSDLAEPILHGDKPVIMFAGEATNPDDPALVNGALDTGRREAHNLLNYLKNVS